MVKINNKRSASSPSTSSKSNVGDHHFFKVYIPSDSCQRLKIPRTFINNLNEALPEKTILKDSFRRHWSIKVKQVEDDFFFQNGWQGFVEKHSLILGEFLVFRYDGNSLFEVKIYDHSGCEKEQNSADKIIDKPAGFINDEEIEAEEAINKTICDSKRKYCGVLKKIGKSGYGCSQPKRIVVDNVDGKKVVSKASSSDKPKAHFMISIDPKNPYHVYIPKQFLIDGKIKLKPKMFLRNPWSKSWPVGITSKDDGRNLITSGWVDFCKDNDLAGNDQCKFEYHRRRGLGSHFIDVHIKRART